MAAEYPDRPVNLMVSLAAGGTTDYITRVLAAGSEKSLGSNFVIENKAGGQGKGSDYDQYLKGLWARSEKMLKEIGIIKEAATMPY
jgi:hypothetical protein